MRILKLMAENFKKLKVVEITPQGNIVTISGKNGAGKSSVLDAIVVALGGKNVAPKKPIREGQDKAVIVVQTEDYVVTRKFSAAGSYLEVKNAEGFKASSPQAVLDKVVGAIAFDPLAFISKSDREQRQVLIELMGVDLAAFDTKIATLTEHRKQLMAQKKTAEVDVARLPKHMDTPAEEVSVASLLSQLNKANAVNKEYNNLREEADRQLSALVHLNEELKQLQAKIASMEKVTQETQGKLATMKRIDVTEIEKRADELAVTNRKVRENQEWGKVQAQIDKLAEQIHADYQAIQEAEAEKARALTGAAMPLPGLSVDESGVLYDGIPLSQVNHARQMEISVAIGMALNPDLRVMLLNGNGLDSSTLATIEKMAKDHDYQLWEEVMDETGKVGIVIEDGMVKPRKEPVKV